MATSFVCLWMVVFAIGFALGADIRALSSCGNGTRVVAITLDDGPDLLYDDTVLAELNAAGVPATFFTAPRARDYDDDQLCSMAYRIMSEGHQVELHTMDHGHLPEMATDAIDAEMRESIEWVQRCTKYKHEPRYFRPPYGELLPEQLQHITDEFGLIISMWNVESGDTDDDANLDPKVVADRVIQQFEKNVGVGNSAVILMHDYYAGMRKTVLTQVINYFKENDYKFVTINECYSMCNTPICKGSGGPTQYPNVYVP